MPEGLDSLYFDSLERVVTLGKQDWRTGYASLMGILLVAQEPLTLAQLQAFTGQSESVIWSYVNDLWQFIGGEEPEGIQEKKYRLYHQSFIDFLGRHWITVI